MKNKPLQITKDIEQLPLKVQNLLLRVVKNFDEEHCKQMKGCNEKYSIKPDKIAKDICAVLKYFIGDERKDYFLLLQAFEYQLSTCAGYKSQVAEKYKDYISDFYYSFMSQKEINYEDFCFLLRRFDEYFHEFKHAYTIPEELAHCLQMLETMYWYLEYPYWDLKEKVDRKIYLILLNYDHSFMSRYRDSEPDLEDEGLADEYEENLICDPSQDMFYEIFQDQMSEVQEICMMEDLQYQLL